MSSTENLNVLDRYAQIGELAERVILFLGRVWIGLIFLLGGAVAVLIFSGNPGAICFSFIAISTLITLAIWKSSGIGLPIFPLVIVQNLFIYGLPIATENEVVSEYSQGFLTNAGIEILVFSCSMAAAWRLGMQVFHPARPVCYALPDFHRDGSNKLRRLGFSLLLCGTLYQVLEKLDLLGFFFALMPSGTSSLFVPLVTGVSACGFFLISLFVGAKELGHADRGVFWALLTISCAISASGFLLSAAITMIGAVAIGLFWSSGKMPWRYLTVVFLVLTFFSISKFTMRGRYWGFDENITPVASGLVQMPAIYLEWTEASLAAIAGSDQGEHGNSAKGAGSENRQTLVNRINNLQNLLYVIDAIEAQHMQPLGGATYTLIPPLLIPRIMWPDKPRSHEGQVLLNVHFGRQDLNSTFKTYVAWGLLPEAYGNFGAFSGSLFLGLFMGLIFAWIENFTARKLLLSLEGFLSFTVLLAMASAFENVASVLITMLFQGIIPIIFASMPFLRRMTVTRPA